MKMRKPFLILSLWHVACVLALTFFYAALVIWPVEHEAETTEVNPHEKELGYSADQDTFSSLKEISKGTREPVIVWWTENLTWLENRKCPGGITCRVINMPIRINRGAYLFYGTKINFSNFPLPRRSGRIIWGLLHEESPRNIPQLMYEKILNIFNYSSTYSRHSDVPMPLAHVGSLKKVTSKAYYYVETVKKNDYLLKGLAPVVYIQSNCKTSTERDVYVQELMKHIDIDSYGDCLNNKRLPEFKFGTDYLNNLKNDDFLKFVAKYKFTIAIENGVCNDYITEKFWRAIRVGSVPIYFGSPTIRDWLPNNKSAILLEDYRTPKALSEHLKKLLADDKLYEEHLEHKTKGLISNNKFIKELKARPYQTNFMETHKQFECFICKKLHTRNIKDTFDVVKKHHFDCPKPVSALSLEVNPQNKWVHLWESLRDQADDIYAQVFNNK